MRFRPAPLVLAAIALQTAGFWTAGCAARGASPVRIDEKSCEEALRRDIAACPDADAARALLAREVVEYAALAERLFLARAALREAASQAVTANASGRPVPGALVEELNRTYAEAAVAVAEVATVAARHDVWRRRDAPRPEPDLRMLGASLSAAAALELYDSFLDTGAVVGAHPTVRKILNRGDAAHGVRPGQIDALTRDYLDLARRYRTHDTIAYVRQQAAAMPAGEDPHRRWLDERIAASPSGAILARHWLVPVGELAGEGARLVASDLKLLGDEAMDRASKGFGNAVGAVQTRHGKLHGDPAIASAVRAVLRPGDVLLEKTPFRLTDRFIPGHWGHVAVWMGGAEEARAILGDDPLLAAHLPRLAAGAGVCEALRDGVQLSLLERFLDIDDLLVLRPRGDQPGGMATVLRRALRQLGKDYDFNFDVETAHRIVCSELVYQVYADMPWPTGKTLGRWTISPDQVAVRALDGGPFEVVDLWHDGRRLGGDRERELKRLLDAAR